MLQNIHIQNIFPIQKEFRSILLNVNIIYLPLQWGIDYVVSQNSYPYKETRTTTSLMAARRITISQQQFATLRATHFVQPSTAASLSF